MENGDIHAPSAPLTRRGRLTDVAYQHLRDVILRGTLPVGSVLAESDLAAELEISRTPVRQALGLLLQEGLVEVGPRRQLIVRGFTEVHRREILLLREALEGTAVRHAAEVIEIEDVDLLRLLLIRQRRAANEAARRTSSISTSSSTSRSPRRRACRSSTASSRSCAASCG